MKKYTPDGPPTHTFLSQDVFSMLSTTFAHISPHTTTTERLNTYLQTFPHALIKEHLSLVPARFQRWWITTCIRGHLSKVKQLRKLLEKNGDLEQRAQVSVTAALWLGHAQRLFEATRFLQTHFGGRPLSEHILSPRDLRLGDIVLSYKTSYYLRHSPLSLFIKYTTNGSVTHIMVACHETGHPPKLLMSDDTTNGLGTLDVVTDPGELFLVLEPLPHPKLAEVYTEIRRIRTIAHKKSQSRTLQKLYSFPELKCEIACMIGFTYIVITLISRYPIAIKNPLEKRPGTFCSELIEDRKSVV